MKIAVNTPTHTYANSKRPVTSLPAPAPLGLSSFYPIKFPNGFELTATSACSLGLPQLAGLQPTIPLPQAKLAPGALRARIVSPTLAATRSTNPKIIQGVRDFTTIFAAHCGKGVKLLHDTAWFGHDFIVFYRDTKAPDVSRKERIVELTELGSSFSGILANLFDAPGFDQASSSLHYAAVIGNHYSSGQLGFSQSELVGLNSAPQAEEYSAILELGELCQSTT